MDNIRMLGLLALVIRSYLVTAVATFAAVVALQAAMPGLVSTSAWIHAGIVAALGFLLPLRLRSARAGHRSGLRAVGIISAVLLLANLVGAVIPGLYPGWMRIEMIVIGVLMAVAVGSVVALALPKERRAIR